jgi:hypothetical protein
MMRAGLLSFVVLLLLIPVFFFSNVNAKARLNEDQALKVMLSAIQKDGLYGSDPNMSCFTVFTEEREKDHFDFSVHKNRGGNCPGSPNGPPAVDRFRIDRSTKKIQWYNPTEGRAVNIKSFLKSRSNK